MSLLNTLVMTDAPKSLVEQLQAQRVQLETQIQDLETQLMRSKEGYLKVLGALEFAAIQDQQVNSQEEAPAEESSAPE